MFLKRLWNEYSALKSATKCSWVVANEIVNEEQNVRLMQFLMGLNYSYYVIRSNMFMASPLPSVMHAYNIMSQEESHKSIVIAFDKSTTTFVAKNHLNLWPRI